MFVFSNRLAYNIRILSSGPLYKFNINSIYTQYISLYNAILNRKNIYMRADKLYNFVN